MNREIKFRAWSSGEMKLFRISPCTITPLWQQGEPLMQYTGLKDRNGKEIYEGDVITEESYPFYGKGELNYVGVVEWVCSKWQYIFRCVNARRRGAAAGINNGLNDGGLGDGEKTSFIVIGNIYENPELLNQGEKEERSVATES